MLLIMAIIQSSVVHANNINTTTNQPSFACFEHFTAGHIQFVHNTMGRRIVLINLNVLSIAHTVILIVVGVIVMWEGHIAQRDIIHVMYKFRIQICRR